MNVLQIHLSDGAEGGGGGIAMHRLHIALRNKGINAQVLCRKKTTDSPYIHKLPKPSKLDYLVKRLTTKIGLNDVHLLSSFKVKHMELFQQADVIDFQGIHTRTLNFLSLPSLSQQKPAVFTMHDMWTMTGHCVSSYDCERWKSGCGNCPYPQTHPAIAHDGTRLEWKLKRWAYAHSNLAFVAPSRWLVDAAKESMFSQHPVYLIPNGVDTEIFQPLDQGACRTALNIAKEKQVLMFTARKLTSHGKGSDLLLQALEQLPTEFKSRTVLLIMGHGDESMFGQLGIETIHLGYVNDDLTKAMAYSAADLFLFPTRAESFGLVSIESQACGTPVVSFRVGGVPDHVRPEITGYLAEPGDAKGFAQGIMQLLDDKDALVQMRQRCRSMVEKEFSFDLLVERYLYLYGQLAKRKSVSAQNDLVTFPQRLDTESVK